MTSRSIPTDQRIQSYNPPLCTDGRREGKPWADKDEDLPSIPFNTQMDKDRIVRVSHKGPYVVNANNIPINPFERTGARGPGTLGRWGPNHAVDAVVTSQNRVLLIKRKDNGLLAFPGGFIDPQDFEGSEELFDGYQKAVCRELVEETHFPEDKVKYFKENAVVKYSDYVYDSRNTDNAWIETMVFHAHDPTGTLADTNVKGGDDAAEAHWVDINSDLIFHKMHANHGCILAWCMKAETN